MGWNATTEHPTIDAGTVIHIDRGYSESPPQNGEEIALAHGDGATTALTVVSAAADRLEVSDGRQHHVLRIHAQTKPNIIDPDGAYREAWIVG